jgi:hypothetical protein
MKKTITIDIVIIAMSLPVVVTVAILAGASQSVLQLAGTALNPLATGMLTNHFLQALILLGPLLIFLCLTIVAIAKKRNKTSYILATLTSASWAFLMFGTLFVRFGP